MKFKKLWIAIWIVTILAVFVLTLINNKPYLLMGGSSSVAPVMEELMQKFPDNHKKVDYNYISSASSGAPPRVENGLFGIGWLSKEYSSPDANKMFTFQMMRDGLVIVYNLSGYLKPNTVLDFDAQKVQDLYLKGKSWEQVFPGQFAKTPPAVQTYTRPNGSGTRDVFDEKCLNNQTFYKANTTDSSSAMLNLDPGSIGYSSFADLEQSDPGKIRSAAGTWERTPPTFDNIDKENYHLWRPFTGLINYNYKMPQEVADILKWIYSTATDNIFKKFGPKIPLTDNKNLELSKFLDKYDDLPDNFK